MSRRPFAFALAGGFLGLSSVTWAAEDNTITVYKTPWCGCCELWTEAVEAAGYKVAVHDMEDLSSIKAQADIPDDMQACHTAVTGGDRKYIIEGHVPLEAVEKMLSERPDIRGIAVPGMPQGSLGMGDDPTAQYTVYTLGQNPADPPVPYLETGQ